MVKIGPMDICIAICTYRREKIADTLKSISCQVVPDGVSYTVIVTDNDDTPNAKQRILALASEYSLNIKYIHAPASNISIARNACIESSTSQYLIFIDDDEIASNTWLSKMISRVVETNADVVFGPVVAIYSDSAEQWIKKCDFHSTKPVFVNGIIETGYTGNTLLNLESVYLKGQRFDLTLGKTGGEDTNYLSRAFKKGARLEFASEAEVYEPVSDERASLKWLIKRRFRVGQSYGATLLGSNGDFVKRSLELTKVFVKIFYCLFISAINFPLAEGRNRWLLRGVLHFGVAAKIMGINERDHY